MRLLDVSLFELLVQVLQVSVVPLVLIFHLGRLKLVLEVALRLDSLFLFDELIVEVFELAEVGDDAALVLLLTSTLLELILVDLKHLQVVAKSEEVPHICIQVAHAVGAN